MKKNLIQQHIAKRYSFHVAARNVAGAVLLVGSRVPSRYCAAYQSGICAYGRSDRPSGTSARVVLLPRTGTFLN